MNFKKIVKENLNIDITTKQLSMFETYYTYLIDYNKKVNLTTITEKEDVFIKHFLDSLLVIDLIDFTKITKVIDMGSGAGLPGIPLKILYPHLDITLVDARKKKLLFIDNLIDKLKLTNIRTKHSRLEDLKENNYYDLALSRALGSLNLTSKYAYRLVKKNGYIISYKSINYEEELKEFNGNFENKIRIIKIDNKNLPLNKGKRINILLKKD